MGYESIWYLIDEHGSLVHKFKLTNRGGLYDASYQTDDKKYWYSIRCIKN